MSSHKEFAAWAEGDRGYPYVDTKGHVTIGRGRNLDVTPLSPDEIDFLYHNDHGKALQGARTFDWFEGLDEVRQMIVVDMIFNMGLTRFKGFVMTIRAIARGDYQTAAREMQDSAWFRQVPRRAIPLVNAMATGKLEYDRSK